MSDNLDSIHVKELVLHIMDERDRRYAQSFVTMDKMIDVLNRSEFVKKPDHELFREQIRSLEMSRSEQEGKASTKSLVLVTAIMLIGLFLDFVTTVFLFMHRDR